MFKLSITFFLSIFETLPIAFTVTIHIVGDIVNAFNPASFLNPSNLTGLKIGLYKLSHTVDALSAFNEIRPLGVRIIFQEEGIDSDNLEASLMLSVATSLARQKMNHAMTISIWESSSALCRGHQSFTQKSALATTMTKTAICSSRSQKHQLFG